MLFARSFCLLAAAGLCVAFGVGVAQAQGFRPGFGARQNPGQQNPGKPLNVKGTIAAVSGDTVSVLANNVQTIFQLSPTAQIKVTGTAEVEYLRHGVYIQFTAEPEAQTGIVKDPVAKLTIASPPPKPAGGTHGHGKQKPAAMGGLDALSPATLAPGTISGTITSKKGNKVTVKPSARGAKPVIFELADTVAIDVNSNDIKLAGNGDNIDVQGTSLPMPNRGVLNNATITLAEPLTGPHRKKPAAKKTGD